MGISLKKFVPAVHETMTPAPIAVADSFELEAPKPNDTKGVADTATLPNGAANADRG